jgi:hypothetical protein
MTSDPKRTLHGDGRFVRFRLERYVPQSFDVLLGGLKRGKVIVYETTQPDLDHNIGKIGASNDPATIEREAELLDLKIEDFLRQLEEGKRAAIAHRASRRALNILDTLVLVLPERIVNEVLGDFVEDINRRAKQGQSNSKIYVRAAAAAFWVLTNTVGYLLKSLGVRKGA